MPKWFKNMIFILIFLVALANFRAIGEGFSQLVDGLGNLFRWDIFHYRDRNVRFAVFGVLIVTIVALWKIFWMHYPHKDN